MIRVSGWRREPVPPARRTPFIGAKPRRGPSGGAGRGRRSGTGVPTLRSGAGVPRPARRRPGPATPGPPTTPKGRSARPAAQHAGHGVDPQERAGLAEVAEGGRRVGRPVQWGRFVPPDLDARAPVAGVERPEAGEHPGQPGELHRRGRRPRGRADQRGRAHSPARASRSTRGPDRPAAAAPAGRRPARSPSCPSGPRTACAAGSRRTDMPDGGLQGVGQDLVPGVGVDPADARRLDGRARVLAEPRGVGQQVAHGRPRRAGRPSRSRVPSSTATSTASAVAGLVTEAHGDRPSASPVTGGRRGDGGSAAAGSQRTTPTAAAPTGHAATASSASMPGPA